MFLRRAALGFVVAVLMAPLIATPSTAAEPAEPAAKAAEAPKPTITRFGVWATRCDQDPKDAKHKECHAFVDVRVGEDKQRLLYLGVSYVPTKTDGSLFLFAITPLGTLLRPGVGFNIDDKTKFGGLFLFCVPLGCQAEAPLTAEETKALKAGMQIEVLFKHVVNGDAKIPVKLEGFSKAIADLPKPKA